MVEGGRARSYSELHFRMLVNQNGSGHVEEILGFPVDQLFPVFAQDICKLDGLRASAMARLPLGLLAAG